MSMTYEEALAVAADFKSADAKSKKYANLRASLQKQLVTWMEENEELSLETDTFTVTYKAAYETKGLDQKALKAVAPDLWETYPKVKTYSASLTLTIKNTTTEDETEE